MLTRVSPRWKTPVPAIWSTATLAVLSTTYAPAYSTLTTACVILLYISYVMPALVGCFALGRTWTVFGPFNLGPRWYRVLAAASVAGTALVVWIGVQPPNDKALGVAVGAIQKLGKQVFRRPLTAADASFYRELVQDSPVSAADYAAIVTVFVSSWKDRPAPDRRA